MDPKWSPQCQRFQYSILNLVHISDDYGLLVGIEVYQAWGCKFVRERNLVAQVLSSQFSNLPELNPWVLCVSWVEPAPYLELLRLNQSFLYWVETVP